MPRHPHPTHLGAPRLLMWLALALLTCALPANAKPLEVALVSQVKSIQPGKPFYAGLHLKHKKGYHTYWKFPGIVGVPISVTWKLPPGWTAGPIEWPEPEQVHMFQIRAQGYHGELVLPMKLTPPATLKPGETITLPGQAAWMCCGRDCNPDFANLTLTVPVAQAAEPDAKWAKLFATALAAAPTPLGKGWEATATRKEKQVTLKLTAQTDAAKAQLASIKDVLFFTDDGYIHADKDQVLKKTGADTLTLTLEVSEYYDQDTPAKVLQGVLRSPQGWGPEVSSQSVIIRAPIR